MHNFFSALEFIQDGRLNLYEEFINFFSDQQLEKEILRPGSVYVWISNHEIEFIRNGIIDQVNVSTWITDEQLAYIYMRPGMSSKFHPDHPKE